MTSPASKGILAIENVTSQFGLEQAIKEPTHILDNSSSCINLIFTSQANLHCVKSVQIRSFSWPVFSCIQTEY